VNEWFSWYLIAVLVLWGISTAKDRNMVRVLVVAAIAAEVMKYGITVHIHGAWKLLFPATLELLTVWAMLRWSSGISATIQVLLLSAAWFAHVICFLDVVGNTDSIYSHYETALLIVAVGQILACYDTWKHIGSRIYNALRVGGRSDMPAVSNAALRPAVLHGQSASQVSKGQG
jgi:hypothetical protein